MKLQVKCCRPHENLNAARTLTNSYLPKLLWNWIVDANMRSDQYFAFMLPFVRICQEVHMLVDVALRDHGRLDVHRADVRL